MNSTIYITYSGNKTAFRGILLSIMSTIKLYKDPIKYYILTADVTDYKKSYAPIEECQIAIIRKVIKEVNEDSDVELIDLTEIYHNTLRFSLNNATEYTPYSMLRLYLDILPLPDKILYLDYDTMVCRSIDELYNIDIEDYDLAACLDYMGRFWMGPQYTNTGVLLLNLKKIREKDIFKNARNILSKKWFKMPDQSAMRKYAKEILIIEDKFNEQRDIKPETVVKHFNKGIKYFPFFHIYNYKQWQLDLVHEKLHIYMFDDIYENYLKLMKEFNFEDNGLPKEAIKQN